MRAWVVILVLSMVLLSGCASTGASKRKSDVTVARAPATSPMEAPPERAEPVETGPEVAYDNAPPERPKSLGAGVALSRASELALEDAAEAIQDGDLMGARSMLARLTSDPHAGFLAAYNLGVLADREGKEGEAIGHFQESLRNNPDFTPALVSLCRLYLRQEKPGLAGQVADRYVRERPEQLDHMDARLQVLLFTGRYEDAIRDAKKVLREDERNVRAMMGMADAYHRLGKHELARSILLQVTENTRDDTLLADVRNTLGFVQLALDDDFGARSSFQKAINHRPDHAEAYNNLGVMYHRARDYHGAAEQFERATELQPRFKEALLNLGNARKGSRDYASAEAAFLSAAEIDNAYAAAYFNLGILYLDGEFEGRDKKEQFQLAIDNFNRYKTEMKARIPRDDPADQYIEEAKKKIEIEKKRDEQNREALQGDEDDDFGDGDDFGDDPFEDGGGEDAPSGDESGDDDDFGDDPFGDDEGPGAPSGDEEDGDDDFGDDPFGDEEGDGG
jgi:Tfp pilus assembly protein PilF